MTVLWKTHLVSDNSVMRYHTSLEVLRHILLQLLLVVVVVLRLPITLLAR